MKKEKKKKISRVITVMACIVVFAIGYEILQGNKFEFNVRFENGTIEKVSKEELQNQVQEKADSSMQHFQITTAPTIHKNTSTSNIFIENNVSNKDVMKTTIVLKDSNTVVLDTDYIDVGKTLVTPALINVPDIGTYEAMAKVVFYDSQTKEMDIENEVELIITVVQ